MKRIEILVSPTGESQVQTKGFSGAGCVQASHFIKKAIGSVSNQQKTAEYYNSADANNQLKNSNGS